MSSQNLGEICPKCVCIACPRKKEGKWTFCLQCRSFYSAQFHCRCHSWFQMDNVPFYLPKYDHRVYDSYFDVKKLVKGECEICKAKLLPYNKREPCNFLKHHESQDRVRLVGETLVDHVGVFCAILKPPNAHTTQNPKNDRKLII